MSLYDTDVCHAVILSQRVMLPSPVFPLYMYMYGVLLYVRDRVSCMMCGVPGIHICTRTIVLGACKAAVLECNVRRIPT